MSKRAGRGRGGGGGSDSDEESKPLLQDGDGDMNPSLANPTGNLATYFALHDYQPSLSVISFRYIYI